MKYLIFFLVLILSSGCSSRSVIEDDNPIKPVSKLYNRNFIVATPTAVGNAICGIPMYLLVTLAQGKPHGSHENWILVPASFCGALTGSLFIPFSYFCDENPWEFDLKRGKRNFKCNVNKEKHNKPLKRD